MNFKGFLLTELLMEETEDRRFLLAERFYFE